MLDGLREFIRSKFSIPIDLRQLGKGQFRTFLFWVYMIENFSAKAQARVAQWTSALDF